MRATLILFFLASATTAMANNGNDLAALCYIDGDFSNLSPIKRVPCLLYIKGVVDGSLWGPSVSNIQLAGEEAKPAVLPFCIPAKVTGGQLVDVVRLYLRSNPQNRHSEAGLLVVHAIAQAFPPGGKLCGQ